MGAGACVGVELWREDMVKCEGARHAGMGV